MAQSFSDASYSRAQSDRLLRDAEAALRFTRSLIDFNSLQRVLLRRSHYDPNQPRVPAGHPDGGQWTKVGASAPSSDHDVSSDAGPDNEWKPGAQYAQSRSGRGLRPPIEFGQAARLAGAQARAQDAIARVRVLDPDWRPTPSLSESVEGLIRTYQAEAQEAEARIADLARVGIGPGPFAAEWIPARGPARDFTLRERIEIDSVGYGSGCHTCGTRNPGTIWGHFIPDHQPPTALNRSGRPQRLYPQCVVCSRNQGLWITRK